jgi:hypothetical protein
VDLTLAAVHQWLVGNTARSFHGQVQHYNNFGTKKFLPFSNEKAVQTSWSQKQAVTYLKSGCSLQVFAKQQLDLLMAQAWL